MKVQTVEIWKTRYGQSVRFVSRTPKGQFVGNKSAKQIIHIIQKGK